MKLNRYSANRLERITRNKKIICFGSGNNLTYVFDALADMKLEKRIKYIVDNDEQKWGKERKVGDMRLQIKPPEELKREDFRKTVLLIVIINYKGISEQIEQELGLKGVRVILYPSYRYWYDKYLDYLYRKLPVKDTILMQGEGDTCENAAALAEYMRSHEHYKNKKITWLCNHPEKFHKTQTEDYILRDLPIKEHKFKEVVKYYGVVNRSYLYIYENKMLPKARKEQISCYMSHGIPLKSTKGKIIVYPDTDYVLSASANITNIIMEQFSAVEAQLIICGLPRTDILYNKDISERLYNYLHLSNYKKMVLWTPTFRKMQGQSRWDSDMKFRFGIPLIDSEESLENLEAFLKKEQVLVVIKPHLYQDMSELQLKTTGNIKVIRQDNLDELQTNVYDLMKLADGLITDYSSIAFDYLLLDRPIGYSIDDIEQYTLGFSVKNPLEYMPGNRMRNMEELYEYLGQLCSGEDLCKEQRRKLRKYLFQYDDGNNCERLLKILGV